MIVEQSPKIFESLEIDFTASFQADVQVHFVKDIEKFLSKNISSFLISLLIPIIYPMRPAAAGKQVLMKTEVGLVYLKTTRAIVKVIPAGMNKLK